MEDHTLLTRLALERAFPADRVTEAVPFARFLADHGADLVEYLTTTAEAEAVEPAAAATPTTPGAFARFLRMNPLYEPRLYVKIVPGGDALIRGAGVAAALTRSRIPPDRSLEFDEIASAPFPYPYAVFRRVEPGETLSALDVIASASDEPDYGMDLGLFDDNGTEWGREYGFGSQPFGDPRNLATSQAPFHMAFFHESPVVYRFAPALSRPLVLLRVRQFSALARFALDRGQDYWGHRFAGWALHYVQDLTMPYHVSALPGKSVAAIVTLGILRATGIAGPYEWAIRDVTEKHVRLERLLLDALYSEGSGDLVRALAPDLAVSGAVQPGAGYPGGEFDPDHLSGVVSARAAALGSTADRALDRAESDPGLLREVFTTMLTETGRVTRAFTAWCISDR